MREGKEAEREQDQQRGIDFDPAVGSWYVIVLVCLLSARRLLQPPNMCPLGHLDSCGCNAQLRAPREHHRFPRFKLAPVQRDVGRVRDDTDLELRSDIVAGAGQRVNRRSERRHAHLTQDDGILTRRADGGEHGHQNVVRITLVVEAVQANGGDPEPIGADMGLQAQDAGQFEDVPVTYVLFRTARSSPAVDGRTERAAVYGRTAVQRRPSQVLRDLLQAPEVVRCGQARQRRGPEQRHRGLQGVAGGEGRAVPGAAEGLGRREGGGIEADAATARPRRGRDVRGRIGRAGPRRQLGRRDRSKALILEALGEQLATIWHMRRGERVGDVEPMPGNKQIEHRVL